jgi:hypothetical protein
MRFKYFDSALPARGGAKEVRFSATVGQEPKIEVALV